MNTDPTHPTSPAISSEGMISLSSNPCGNQPRWRAVSKIRFRAIVRHALLVAACMGGLLATNGSALAATSGEAWSAPALFNEANVELRAGRVGPAILNYERARLLAPRDGEIIQNLDAAREKAGVKEPAIPYWQKPAFWLQFNELAVLFSISLFLTGLLVMGAQRFAAARVIAMGLGVVALFAASAVAIRWPELNRGVIVGDQPVAHIAPAESSAEAFAVKPGEIVGVEGRHGEFVRVRIADGRSGWIADAEVERIIPDNA